MSRGVRVCDTPPLLIPTPGRTEARLLRPGQRPANIAPPSLSPAREQTGGGLPLPLLPRPQPASRLAAACPFRSFLALKRWG